MELKPLKRFWPTVGLGVVSGMRTMSAISTLSGYLSRNPSPFIKGFPFGFLQKKYTAVALKALTLAEFTADKMPDTPDRIVQQGLISRGLAGAITGAALYKARNGSAIAGFLIGGTAAVAATYGSYYLRKTIVESTEIKDPTIGGIEDIVALQSAFLIL